MELMSYLTLFVADLRLSFTVRAAIVPMKMNRTSLRMTMRHRVLHPLRHHALIPSLPLAHILESRWHQVPGLPHLLKSQVAE